MSAVQRGWIAVLCLVLSLPAAAQQPYQLAPLGFSLDGVDPDRMPRPSRAQWRSVLSAFFPAVPSRRLLQRDMIIDGYDRRRDVSGAFDSHGLSEAPPDRQHRWPDLEWRSDREGYQYLSIVPITSDAPLETIARMTAAKLNGGPCGPLPVVGLGRLLPARPGMQTFAVECRGESPTPGGGIGQTGGVAAVVAVAGGLALSYAAHGAGAGSGHINRFDALVQVLRPEDIVGRQALPTDRHAAVMQRFGPALQARSTSAFVPIDAEEWERAGPMNTRLCDAKWGTLPGAVTCLRLFPARLSPDTLLAQQLQVDHWECRQVRIVERKADDESASATLHCGSAGAVGGIATRLYAARRSPADGSLAFTAVYGHSADAQLRAMRDMVDGAVREVLGGR